MIRPFAYSLAASLALNAAAMLSVDRAFFYENQKAQVLKTQQALREERDKLPFEFIEAPLTAPSQKPARAKKMSSRDTINRDPSGEKAVTDRRPQIEKVGPSDQLAQFRAKPSGRSSAASPPKADPPLADKPQQEMKKMEAVIPQKAQEKPKSGADADKLPPLPVQMKDIAVKPVPQDQKRSQASLAQSGKEGSSGLDRITTQAMARAKSRGASLSGATSFDAMGSDMGVYMKNVKERIWLAWFPYLSFQYPNDFQAADAVILFTLNAQGEVKSVKVLDSYGSPVFTTFCTQVIQRASGFGPVPKEILALLGREDLEIRFAFHYR